MAAINWDGTTKAINTGVVNVSQLLRIYLLYCTLLNEYVYLLRVTLNVLGNTRAPAVVRNHLD